MNPYITILIGFYTGVLTLHLVQLLKKKNPKQKKKKKITRKKFDDHMYFASRSIMERYEELQKDPRYH